MQQKNEAIIVENILKEMGFKKIPFWLIESILVTHNSCSIEGNEFTLEETAKIIGVKKIQEIRMKSKK